MHPFPTSENNRKTYDFMMFSERVRDSSLQPNFVIENNLLKNNWLWKTLQQHQLIDSKKEATKNVCWKIK